MHHRALRVVPPNVSLSTILQVAAGQAWARTTATDPPSNRTHFRGRARPTRHPSTSIVHLRPQDVQDSDLDVVDPGRSLTDSEKVFPSFHPSDTSIPGTPVGPFVSHTPIVQRFPLAKTAASLHQNLVYLINHRHPLPTLSSLLDYHDRHRGLRSARSYNILISFAIRNAAYGSAEWLFRAMHADGLPETLETWKLRVRWLVQTGRWGQVSNELLAPSSLVQNSAVGGDKPMIPLPIWLELFRTLKRGSIRRRTAHWRPQLDGRDTLYISSEPIREHDLTTLCVTRYHSLLQYRPLLTREEVAQTPPRVVYSIVMVLFKCGQGALATSLTKVYFTGLPDKISKAWARTCLAIIHLHILFGSPDRGLRRLYETRRILVSLLRLLPSLRPTSTTLFLLLAPLKDVKRCGTVAQNILRSSKKQWGARMEDRRVRRRVATLAAKEGRMDIVDRLLRAERTLRWPHGAWKMTRSALGGVVLSRRIYRRVAANRIFKHNGQEERHWCRFLKRMRRRNKMRQGQEGRMATLCRGAAERQVSSVQTSV